MSTSTANRASWKQLAMQKAEHLTDIWDVVKAWLGRAAEIVLTLCMFAQLIGMLPGVTYPPFVNNVILGVQIIMLDFGAFALAPLAEQARNAGQDEAAQRAENMSRFLIALVMTTIIIIIVGQFAPLFKRSSTYITGFVTYAEPVLILVRVACVVKYIHVIHSLRATTLEVQPLAPADVPGVVETVNGLVDRMTALSTQIESLQKHVHTFANDLSTQQREQRNAYADLVDSVNALSTPSVDVHQLSQLAVTLSTQVTEVRNVLAAGGTIESAASQRTQPKKARLFAQPQPVETSAHDIPVLDVPGISQERIEQVISLRLQGMTWREMPGNYSRTIKPIREAYEQYLDKVSTGEQACLPSVDSE